MACPLTFSYTPMVNKDAVDVDDETNRIRTANDWDAIMKCAVLYHAIHVNRRAYLEGVFGSVCGRRPVHRSNAEDDVRIRNDLAASQKALNSNAAELRDALEWMATHATVDNGFSAEHWNFTQANVEAILASDLTISRSPSARRTRTVDMRERSAGCGCADLFNVLRYRIQSMTGQLLVLVFLALNIAIPLLLVSACCFAAMHMSEESDYADLTLVLARDNSTLEALGAVLGFLLALAAQSAADRYATGERLFCEMVSTLERAAQAAFYDIKVTKSTIEAKLHWELSRLLHVLLVFSSRELQSVSLRGLSMSDSQTRALIHDALMTDAEHEMIAGISEKQRVYLLMRWLDSLFEASLTGQSCATVRSLLQHYHKTWLEAIQLAKTPLHSYFDMIVKILLYTYCCTFPFALVASLGNYVFVPALLLTGAFFFYARGSAQNGRPLWLR